MWITVCCSGRLGEAGGRGLAVEGWGSRSTGCLFLFRGLPLAMGKERRSAGWEGKDPISSGGYHLPLKLDQSENSDVLRVQALGSPARQSGGKN